MSAPPFKVKAVYEYSPDHDEDLSFPVGQIITVTEEEDADWYVGEYTSAAGTKEAGLFPKNFVERFEPETPPRPVRSKPRKDASSASQAPADSTSTAAPQEIEDAEPPKEVQSLPSAVVKEDSPVPSQPSKMEATLAAKPEPKPAAASKPAPPAVADKPSSFKDRIAAFNKSSQAPLAPVKPGGLPSAGGFIKKPFVAPPPSRDAYVPPPRAAPSQKIYKREEDPEIAERQAQDQADAEKAGLVQPEGAEEGEEAPKQSLKDRIAMLQKQQLEQASRRADLSAKEKPKKPSKRRTDPGESPLDVDEAPLTTVTSAESTTQPALNTPQHIASPSLDRGISRDRLSSELSPREILSDENDADQSGAGDTTEDAEGSVDESDEKPKNATGVRPPPVTGTLVNEPDPVEGETPNSEEEEEEEDEVDEETRRKIELRERMAKMSGGMGMAGMFGGGLPMPGAVPRKKKQSSGASDGTQAADSQGASAPAPPQRLPIIPGPREASNTESENRPVSVEKEEETSLPSAATRDPGEIADVEDLEPQPSGIDQSQNRGTPSSALQDRPLPPAPPTSQRAVPLPPQSRPVPRPPPTAPQSTDPGMVSDEDIPVPPKRVSTQPPPAGEREMPVRGTPPPVPGPPKLPGRPESNSQSPTSKRASGVTPPFVEPMSPNSDNKRQVPPIPLGSPQMLPPSEIRPPPPPPPTAAPPSRRSTDLPMSPSPGHDADENDESDYEGDYDTDIASAAPPNHALKAHAREMSVDDESFSEATPGSPMYLPPTLPPPLPASAQRAPPPPPPPQQQLRSARQSMEAPRAPPPVPSTREMPPSMADDEYDPYRHNAPTHGITSDQPTHGLEEAVPAAGVLLPSSPPPRAPDRTPTLPQSPPTRQAIPPPPPPHAVPATSTSRQSREVPRQSLDVPYSQGATSRRSTDLPRGSTDQGYIAQDIDLGETSQWWVQQNMPPPAIQNRSDVLFEIEESVTSKRGGRSSVSKDVYVLFIDYSQTIISARFDTKMGSDVSLEQRHEAPPARMRQDQLEDAHGRFGYKISEAAAAKQNSTVGDGSPNALVLDLLKPFADALFPVGNRAYGALVYSNMANATFNQSDEIRPGDIITFRNAKFQGKHGAMHQKYSLDVGKPDHVGVVVDWDGTKKKVRAWEQGRDGSKKVKVESFRMGDLRSGEVKVWRVMSRNWVGWEGSN